jgi:hypothetical protein
MTTVSQTTVAANLRKTLDVHGHFAAQITFYCEASINDLPQAHYV